MFEELNQLINRCRCGGTARFRLNCYWIRCESCDNQSNDGDVFVHDKPNPKKYLLGIIDSWNKGNYHDWQDDYNYHCAILPLERGSKAKLAKPEHYAKLLNKSGAQAFYCDQATKTSQCADKYFFSAFTPSGIQLIDRWYILRIQELKKPNARFKYTAPELEEMILKNPHLHPVIKSNLVENLKNYAGA